MVSVAARVPHSLCLAVVALTLAFGCRESTSPSGVHSVVIVPADQTVHPGETVRYASVAMNAAGAPVKAAQVRWYSSNSAIAVIDSLTGVLTAIGEGDVFISAISEGATGTTRLLVRVPVRTITVLPDTVSIEPGATVALSAVARDSLGNVLSRSITWTSTYPLVASVDAASGVVTANQLGVTTVRAASDGVSALTTIRVQLHVASIQISPAPVALRVGTPRRLTTLLRDSTGLVVSNRRVRWSSTDPAVASIDSVTGIATGVAVGTASILATSEGKTASVSVTVSPSNPVATVTVTPNPARMVVSAEIQLAATLRNAQGDLLLDREVVWTSQDPSIASVDVGSGTVKATGAGSVTITATSEGVSGSTVITVEAFASTTIDASTHSCGITTSGAAYCWGKNGDGELGDGTTVDRPTPVAVVGGRRFHTIVAGERFTIALADNGVAYSWGTNSGGVLGDSTAPYYGRTTPDLVAGDLHFKAIAAHWYHVIALTFEGEAYGWGTNGDGQLGDGTTESRPSPVRVNTDVRFKAIDVGVSFSVALSVDGRAYGWGDNRYGALGDNTTQVRLTPVPAAGGLTFTAIAAGSFYTLGLDPSGKVYGWGIDNFGQLGNGTFQDRLVPTPMSGTRTFVAVTAGFAHTVALTAAGDVYTWGMNRYGQLGYQAFEYSPTAKQVPGIRLRKIFAGTTMTGGIDESGKLFTWGDNTYGQLGDGTKTSRAVPLPVAGAFVFK